MTPEEWDKVSEIFHTAADMEPGATSAYLDKACAGDATLRMEVDSLLSAHRRAGSFISEPAIPAENHPQVPTLSGSDLGHFRIERSIGKGGMGEVYLATDTRLNRKVAIKKLPDRLASDPGFLKRFQTEARAAATLNHPNVATVYSVENFDGKPFITMEYVDGQTLESSLPPEGLELKAFVDLFATLADALDHAHKNGVTHRDIKPGNIMISSSGVPKILDFGLAQIAAESHPTTAGDTDVTLSGQVIGTPSYMSPEQARGEDVDQRSDIFSFGVLMYEAITGSRPFPGDSHAEVVSNLLKSEPKKVSSFRPGLPNSIIKLISGCLKKKKAERFQRMKEVEAVLQETRSALESGTSSGAGFRRIYTETPSSSFGWLAGAAAVVIAIAALGWFYVLPGTQQSPYDLQNIAIKRLSNSQNVVYAHVSPDGRSVVFNTIEENEERSMWIRRIDDPNALRLVGPQPVQYWGGLAINQDSSQIYYATAEPAAAHGTMYSISPSGGQPKRLVESVNDVGSLSPDGRRILFVRYGGRNEIRTAGTENGGDEVLIADMESSVIPRDPQFSLDGTSIYYIRVDRTPTGGWSLINREISSGKERAVIEVQPVRMSELAVLGTGHLLLNSTDPISNLPQLFHVDSNTGSKTRITNDLNSYFGISVDGRGEKIIAAQRQDIRNIWVGKTSDPNNIEIVPNSTGANLRVEWTPDGRIVYDALDNGVPHIWLSPPNGSGRRQLTPSESRDLEATASPDGKYIVFTSNRTGENKIWRMNLDGSGETLLTPVDGVADGPRFGPDGQTVLFNWRRGNARVVGSVSVLGGAVGEVSGLGDGNWTMSPDGRRVAYVIWNEKLGRSQVAIRPVNSSESERILDIWPAYIFQWSSDGRALLYRERQAGEMPHATIMRRDLEADEPRIFFSKRPEHVSHLAFSNDGEKFAIIRGQLLTDAVLITQIPR